MDGFFSQQITRSPIVAVAVHDGHDLRPEVAELMALDDSSRLREEDPHTGALARLVPSHVVVHRSRFEVDLNRPRDKAVYLGPADCWGLDLWRSPPPPALVEESLAWYDAFYESLHVTLAGLERLFGCFVVLDVHSYNHRREGSHGPHAPASDNPQINVGTASLDRGRWGFLVDRFMATLGRVETAHGPLDVRENVRFRGGQLSRWVHENFRETGCALAVEIKKIYMDEWTGQCDRRVLEQIGAALSATFTGLVEDAEALALARPMQAPVIASSPVRT